jgi:hypothetical protein
MGGRVTNRQSDGVCQLDEIAFREDLRFAEDAVRMIQRGRLVIDPELHEWDVKKQSRLIESILMRIPLPVFYAAENSDGRLTVVDGRQRLTTIKRFIEGDLALSLEARPELHGKKFAALEQRLQNRIDNCRLLFYIIDHAVPERARPDIFERVKHNEEEQ